MAVKNITTLKTDTNSTITTNGARAITGALHNALLQDILDSCVNRISDVSILGLFDFSSSQTYKEGQAVIYNDGGGDQIYRANKDNGPAAFNALDFDALGSTFTLANGSGTTANGSSVDLGGVVNSGSGAQLTINATAGDPQGLWNMSSGFNSATVGFIVYPDKNNVNIYNGVVVSESFSSLEYFDGTNFDRMYTYSGGIVIDTSSTSLGAVYAADYSANYTDRSLVDKGFTKTHIGDQDVNALVTTPTATEDGYAIVWDNTAGEYQLQSAGGISSASNGLTVDTGVVKLGGDLTENTNIDLYDSVGVVDRDFKITQGVTNTSYLTLNGDGTFSLGVSASPFDANCVTIGLSSSTTGTNAIAIKGTASANTVAIGGNTSSATGNSIAINGGTTSGSSTIAMGSGSNASVSYSTAIGFQTTANSNGAIAIGAATTATSDRAISLGIFSDATATASVAIGDGADATALRSVSIGDTVQNGTSDSVAFGWNATSPDFLLGKTATSYLNGSGAVVVGGTTETNSSVSMDFQSTTRVPKLPVLTTTERDALTATDGMIIMNSTTATIQGYFGAAWNNL
jgi:hypothetical protein